MSKNTIKSISINNFKVFDKQQNFELNDIQFLIGPNNLGKSSLMDFLTQLKLGLSNGNIDELDLTGTAAFYAKSFKETVSYNQKSFDFEIEYDSFIGNHKVGFRYKVDSKNQLKAGIDKLWHTLDDLSTVEFDVIIDTGIVYEKKNVASFIKYLFEKLKSLKERSILLGVCKEYQDFIIRKNHKKINGDYDAEMIIPEINKETSEALNQLNFEIADLKKIENYCFNNFYFAEESSNESIFRNKSTGKIIDFIEEGIELNSKLDFNNTEKGLLNSKILQDGLDAFENDNKKLLKVLIDNNILSKSDFVKEYELFCKYFVFWKQNQGFDISNSSYIHQKDTFGLNLDIQTWFKQYNIEEKTLWDDILSNFDFIKTMADSNSMASVIVGLYTEEAQKKNTFNFEKFVKGESQGSNKSSISKNNSESSISYLNSFLVTPIINSIELLNSYCDSLDLFSEKIRRKPYELVTDQSDKIISLEKVKELRTEIGKKDNGSMSFINFWLQKTHLADEVIFDILINNRNEKEIGYSVFLKKGNNETPITNCGSGVTQILKLLVRIAAAKRGTVILVEEPEVNLHPALQSMIADILVDGNKRFGHKFIVETHSEYIIRKMRLLIAKGEIKNDKCTVHYFEKNNNELNIRKINFTTKGKLTSNFGEGFFDESTTMNLELLRTLKEQSN